MKISYSIFQYLLALLLWNIATSSQAIDEYQPATQTLDIPRVQVGTTIYKDVVLELRDFEVLRVGADPFEGVVDNGVLVQFVSATQQGEQMKLALNITTLLPEVGTGSVIESYLLIGDSFPNFAKTIITDDKGNTYSPDVVTIENTITSEENEPFLYFILNANTPTSVVFTYNNVASDAESIQFLYVAFSGRLPIIGDDFDDDLSVTYIDDISTFRFGNLPLQKIEYAN